MPRRWPGAVSPPGSPISGRRGHTVCAARHHAALEPLLTLPRLAHPDGSAWFPADVARLASHGPGQPGHLPCLAIVLLDALRTGDAQSNAKYRMDRQAVEIAALDPPVRDTFLAAFRHLYESMPLWSPPVAAPFILHWASPPQT